MKLSKKITAIAAGLAMMLAFVMPQNICVKAAGTETVLYTFFTESPDVSTPDSLGPDAALTSGIDPSGIDGFDIWSSWGDSGTSYGFSPSAGNVHRTILNNPSKPRTSLPGREVVFAGTRFLYHTEYNYGLYFRSIKDYEATASVTVKVCFSSESYIKDAYVYLKSYAGGVHSYTGVKVSDWFTADDVGKPVHITIPVKEFVDKGENTYSINGGFDPANLAGAGIMLVNPDSEEQGYMAYDDFYICNVLAPTELTANDTTDSQTTLSWIASTSNVEKYLIYRNGEFVDETTDVTYTDTNLEAGKNYTYVLYAQDRYGARSVASNSTDIYTSSVGAPLNMQAVSSFADELKCRITWEAPVYGTPTGYEIYRDNKLIGETGADELEYIDKGEFEADTFHTYYVVAKTDNDVSMKSAVRTVLITYIGYPEEVNVDGSGEGILLSWSAIDSAASYKIYRNGAVIANVKSPTCEYKDVDIDCSTAYTYSVTSVNELGKESGESKRVIIVKNEPNKVTKEVYGDKASDDYYISSIGKSVAESSEDQVAQGVKSCKVTFAPAAYDVEGVSFTPTASLDLSAARSGGGRIEFFLYAQDSDMIDNVMVGLECITDKLASQTYTARTGIKLSNYVKQYGYWSYVSIPIADFSPTGVYSADIASKRYCKFKFDSVRGLDFYMEDAHYLAQKSIFVDGVCLAEFEQPKISGVSLADGTKIENGAEVSATTDELNVTFDCNMDESSFDGNVKLESAGEAFPVECAYDSASRTVKVSFVSGLKSSASFSLRFDGIKSIEGAAVSGTAFDFVTNSDSTGTVPEMADVEYIKCNSASVERGNTHTLRIYVDSDAAKRAPINSMNVVLKYDPSVLNTTDENVIVATSLSGAEVRVNNSNGVITINIPKQDDSKIYVIGSYIADIKFTAKKIGGSSLSLSGLAVQASPEKEIKLQQKDEAAISVTGTSSSQGGGGSSKGGGRKEATASGSTSIGLTDSTLINKTDDLVFSDINSVSWANDAIKSLAKLEIVKGYDDGTFRPQESVMREELMAMIIRAFAEIDENAKCNFSDVSTSDWSYSAVATASSLGIVNGFDENTFGIGTPVTRQDMCAMLVRAAQVCGIDLPAKYNTSVFVDNADIAKYAADSVQKLQVSGIINGLDDNRFAPNDTVTRAMAAKAIYEMFKLK